MAEVPAAYIADLPVDWRAELAACLRVGTRVAGAVVPAPTLGAMALLEWIDSRAVARPWEADHLDCLRALYILASGRGAADVAMQAGGPGCSLARFGDRAAYCRLDWAALEWGAERTDGRLVGAGELLPLFDAAFAGWRTIPPSGGGGGEYLFGPESIARVLLICAPLNLTAAALLWETPLCLLGHLAAAVAESNGTKGVARPKDPADVKRQLAASAERERTGEIHPWQRDHPDRYGPSAEQLKARPAIQAELHALHMAWRGCNG